MNTSPRAYLKSIRPELTLEKYDGVYYLLGHDERTINDAAERCMHATALRQIRPCDIDDKLNELAIDPNLV